MLSTLPAIASTLLGTLTGTWLLSRHRPQNKLLGMGISSLFALSAGWLWGLWMPLNKALWTSSFVLWTTGWALLFFSLCYWLIEMRAWRKPFKPFEIFGLNALAAYFLHIFFLKLQSMIHIPRLDGSPGNLRFYITEHLFAGFSLKMASLMYALLYVGVWLVVLTVLYRKKIFIKA